MMSIFVDVFCSRDGESMVDVTGRRLFGFKRMVLKVMVNALGECHSLGDGGRAGDRAERLRSGGHCPASARILRLWHV